MTKKQYREFCLLHPSVPLFSQAFWLDVVSEDWEVASHTHKGKITGVLPYSIKGNFLTKRIYIPALTAYSGPVLFCPDGHNEYEQRSFEKKIIGGLLDQLPDKLYQARFKCYPSLTNWLPFHWKGYQQSGRYTYLLDTAASKEKIFGQFKDAHQRQIRKAEKMQLSVETGEAATLLFQLFSKTFQKQHVKTPFSKAHFIRIYHAVKQHSCGEVFLAKNKNGKILAAIFVVWDAGSMYYLLGYFDEQESNSGAMTYLFWQVIQLAKEKKVDFNFEGSMLESIEQYFRGFGGKLTPVHFISK